MTGTDRIVEKGSGQRALLYIEGRNDLAVTDTLDVLTSYVPVNTCTFQVTNNVQLVSGERVRIVRPLRKNGLLLSVVIFLAEVFLLWAGKKERWIWFGIGQ